MSPEPMSTVSTQVDTPADSVRPPGGSYPWTRTPVDSPSLAEKTSTELLRLSLLAKLAVDLGDPVLARRAARHAVTSARLLAGLDWQAPRLEQDDEDDDLPELDELLERLPSRTEVEGAGADTTSET